MNEGYIGSRSQLSIPRFYMFGRLHTYSSILTLQMSHHKYNKWLDKVGIGIHCLNQSHQPVFETCGDKIWPDLLPLFTPRSSVFELIEVTHDREDHLIYLIDSLITSGIHNCWVHRFNYPSAIGHTAYKTIAIAAAACYDVDRSTAALAITFFFQFLSPSSNETAAKQSTDIRYLPSYCTQVSHRIQCTVKLCLKSDHRELLP